jgi:mannan endo-1,4-beta-mannosidase
MTYWDGYRWRPEAPKRLPPRPHPLRDAIATFVMILGLFAIAFPFNPAAAGAPTLSLAPSSASVGSSVGVGGATFPAKATVQFLLDGSAAGMPRVKASPSGTIKTTFVVPQVATGGHVLGAQIASSRGGHASTPNAATVVATVTLTVTEPTSTPTTTPGPTVTASPAPTPASTGSPIASSQPTPAPTLAATPSPTLIPPPPSSPPGPVTSFVTRSGAQLFANGGTFRFHGLNLYDINGDGDCGYAIPDLGSELDAIGGSANVVRGWFFQYLATNHATGARDWTKMDSTLATLRAHGVRVVATLGDQWGACEAAASRTQLTQTWYQSGYKAVPYSADVSNSYRGWVTEIVTRYRNDPTIVAWQLMNEATAVTDAGGSCPDQDIAAAALQAWAADMATVVKSIDPNHLLSVGTSGSSQCGTTGSRYQALYAIPGVDICESHDYTSPAVAISDGVLFEIASCANLGKPIFVGEVGITGSDVGGNLIQRASLYSGKFTAQMAAGMAGELVWAWRSTGDGGSSLSSYDIGPGDPTLSVLAGLATH